MALNMSNKKWICNQILPEAEFSITGNGITITSERLTTPRFIPFDINGKCRECKSTELELDFVVTKEGITLFCSRNKQNRFLPFDAVYELPGYCFFRVKNKARVFNVPHGSPPEPQVISQNEIHVKQSENQPTIQKEPSILTNPILPKESEAPIMTKTSEAHIAPNEPKFPIAQKETAPIVTPMELETPIETKKTESETPPLSPGAQEKFEQEDIKQTWENEINEFYASLAAATAGIPSQPKRKKIQKEPAPNLPKESEMPTVPKAPEVPIATNEPLPNAAAIETKNPETPKQELTQAVENDVNEFYASLAAATAGIPSQPKRKKMRKQNENSPQ